MERGKREKGGATARTVYDMVQVGRPGVISDKEKTNKGQWRPASRGAQKILRRGREGEDLQVRIILMNEKGGEKRKKKKKKPRGEEKIRPSRFRRLGPMKSHRRYRGVPRR